MTSSQKSPMSASYIAVFVFAIVMCFLCLAIGAGTNSKNGFGVFLWGCVIWWMYKRDNKQLVEFFKISLWLTLGVASICAVVITYFDNNYEIDLRGYLILFLIASALDFLLLKFFEKQVINDLKIQLSNNANATSLDLGNKNPSTNLSVQTNLSNTQQANNTKSYNSKESTLKTAEENIYLKIYEELETKTYDKGLWIRLFAEADGDENKTKVLYVRERYSALTNSKSPNSINEFKEDSTKISSPKLKQIDVKDEYYPFNKFTVIDTIKEFNVDRETAKKIIALNIRKLNNSFLYKHLTFKTLEEALEYAKVNPQKK